MSSDPTNASAAQSQSSESGNETAARDPSKRIDEGLGVFRALILMLMFYAASASMIWLAWYVWHHWYAH